MTLIQEVTLCGFIGMVLQMLMKAKSIQDKAKLSNVEFKFREYFINDWLSHLISAGAIVLYVLLAKRRILASPDSVYELILGVSATVGYSGADIVSRFFSFTNKKVNAAIDHKTSIADTASGTLDKPTPK